jgi:glycosyltransferase involved in cell wall biosynthesis
LDVNYLTGTIQCLALATIDLHPKGAFSKKKDIPGSPLKLWEYMACGKPVIATNTEDFKVLEGYNAGILVDPEKPEEVADAITTLLKNKDLREEMGNNGRRYVVENRSWGAVAGEVEKVMRVSVKEGAKSNE